MRFKNFIFDLDGTLINSKAQTVNGYECLAKELLGRGLTDEEKVFAFHKTSSQTLALLGIEENDENYLKLYNYFMELSKDVEFYAGITDVLGELLKRDVFIGIATNRNRMEGDFAFEYNGLAPYFKDYICKDDVKNSKPSGEMLVSYMEKHNLNPSDTIFIGNAPGDHMAAIDAVIQYGLCEWGTEEYIDEEAIIFNEPKDILKLL